ncbi:hypothetical protein ACFPPD_09965 [Cohnella suwonensis]|uniref:Uncharacterized protein n=1 Tax=Cohnella suwonensis TaxID=696072 RepID=A0ABW0LT78_9BACL
MAVVICPWCQSEIVQEEGQEPEKYCPICDNELDGYRTLRVNIGEDDEEEAEDEETFDDDRAGTGLSIGIDDDDDIDWVDDEEPLVEQSDELLLFEETVEHLVDEQELVPECPQCREYMLETGEQLVSADHFRPRAFEALGGGHPMEAPFTLTMYVCPSCFAVQSILGDAHRHQLVRKLSQPQDGGK